MGTRLPKNYEVIREHALDYQAKSFLIKGQMKNPDGLDFDNLPLIIFMEKANVERLLGECTNPGDKLAAVMNVEGDHFTVALLCANSEDKIFPAHLDGTLDGEETWPTMITVSEQNKIEDTLVEPTFKTTKK